MVRRYSRMAGLVGCLIALAGCTSTPPLSPAPGTAATPTTNGFLLARLVADNPSAAGAIVIGGSGGLGQVKLPFGTSQAVTLVPVQPGTYSFMAVQFDGGQILLNNNHKPFDAPLLVKAGQVVYIGDWLATGTGTMRKIAGIHQYSIAAFTEFATAHPELAAAARINYFAGDDEVRPGSLKQGEVVLRNENGFTGGIPINHFSAAYTMMEVFSQLDLWGGITPSDQQRIVNYLFDGIPRSLADLTVARQTVIGKLRSDGSDLLIQLIAAPYQGARVNGMERYSVWIGANVTGPQPGTASPRSVPSKTVGAQPDFYQLSLVLLSTGNLVPPDDLLSSDQYTREKNEIDPGALINLTDALIQGGAVAPVDEARPLLLGISGNPKNPRSVRTAAELNLVMLDCQEGRYSDAGSLLATIQKEDLSQIDPSFMNIIEVQAPALIRLVTPGN